MVVLERVVDLNSMGKLGVCETGSESRKSL